MYGKVFEQIFDSTLMADGGSDAVYVFMCLITLANRDGVVGIAKPILAKKIDISNERLDAALDILFRDDPESNISEFGGRRVIPMSEVDWIQGNRGFLVVNYETYAKKASAEDRKEQNRLAKQRQRQRESQQTSAPVSNGQQESAESAHIDIDIDIDIDKEEEAEQSEDCIGLALKGAGWCYVRDDMLKSLIDDYPLVNVKAELRKMSQWLDANPRKRKTEKGIKRFIVNWLNQAKPSGPMRDGFSKQDYGQTGDKL